jgi:antitoxin HicB
MRAIVLAYPATLKRDAAGRFLIRFPDLPEALSDGASEEEALREGADALSEALMSRLIDGEDIPDPGPVRRDQYQVALDTTVALKVALAKAMREKKGTAAELSRLLPIDHAGCSIHANAPRSRASRKRSARSATALLPRSTTPRNESASSPAPTRQRSRERN